MKPPYKVICFLGVFILNILCGHPDCTNVTFQETMSVLAAVLTKQPQRERLAPSAMKEHGDGR